MEKAAGRRVYHGPRGQKAELGEREKRRLIQLGVCLVLFFVVFFAKGMDRLTALRTELRQWMSVDMDVRAVFAGLGRSLASDEPASTNFGELWTDVFFPREMGAGEAGKTAHRGPVRTPAELLDLNGGKVELSGPDPMAGSRHLDREVSASAAVPEPEGEMEPAVTYVDYDGPALPENTTMDRYALGLAETVSPVDAAMTSGFGWREHPIFGGEKFHYGVDLAVGTGTTVRAFAAGEVEYIGESDIYGQYLQLDHGNGVSSFYAHCSKLCVQQGQRVELGEKVAESGATGDVTGPHLHFEMKKDGVRLNPAYYIQILS